MEGCRDTVNAGPRLSCVLLVSCAVLPPSSVNHIPLPSSPHPHPYPPPQPVHCRWAALRLRPTRPCAPLRCGTRASNASPRCGPSPSSPWVRRHALSGSLRRRALSRLLLHAQRSRAVPSGASAAVTGRSHSPGIHHCRPPCCTHDPGGGDLYPSIHLLPWTTADGSYAFFQFSCNFGVMRQSAGRRGTQLRERRLSSSARPAPEAPLKAVVAPARTLPHQHASRIGTPHRPTLTPLPSLQPPAPPNSINSA